MQSSYLSQDLTLYSLAISLNSLITFPISISTSFLNPVVPPFKPHLTDPLPSWPAFKKSLRLFTIFAFMLQLRKLNDAQSAANRILQKPVIKCIRQLKELSAKIDEMWKFHVLQVSLCHQIAQNLHGIIVETPQEHSSWKQQKCTNVKERLKKLFQPILLLFALMDICCYPKKHHKICGHNSDSPSLPYFSFVPCKVSECSLFEIY